MHETVRAFKGGELPPPMEALNTGMLVQGRIKLTCPKCGKISDQMWEAIVDAHDINDNMVCRLQDSYDDRSKEMWERMRRGEPEPDPGPSNCEYITFEGMYYR